MISKIKHNINRLISKSFPKLKGKQIDVKICKGLKKKPYMACALFNIKGGYLIKVNPNIAFLSNKALTGLLAHELVHIENYVKKSFLRNTIELLKGEFLRYLLLCLPKWQKEHRKKHKKTDIEVVKRGYGNELIEYKRFQCRSLKPKLLKDIYRSYLSEKEIKSMMKK